MSIERSLRMMGYPQKSIDRATLRGRVQPIGHCHYCTMPLYADQPTSDFDEPLSHVACAVYAREHGTRQ